MSSTSLKAAEGGEENELTSATLMNLFANSESAMGSGLDAGRGGGAGDILAGCLRVEEVMVSRRKGKVRLDWEDEGLLLSSVNSTSYLLSTIFAQASYRSPSTTCLPVCTLTGESQYFHREKVD